MDYATREAVTMLLLSLTDAAVSAATMHEFNTARLWINAAIAHLIDEA